MYTIIDLLFNKLNTENISYCHWKSNVNLDKALDGYDDLDLLVDQRDSNAFKSIIFSLLFKEAFSRNTSDPAISHYYGYDERSGDIIHLHVYYRIITGGSICKNYHLPCEQMLLQETNYIGSVRVPSKAAELVMLVVRKMLEHASLAEIILFYKKESKEFEKELLWLTDRNTEFEVKRLLSKWLPILDETSFFEALRKLKTNISPLRRIIIASKIKRRLKPYRLRGALSLVFVRYCRTVHRLIYRIIRKKNKRKFVTGGSVIGIVGPEATGKSTICDAIIDWLGDSIHTEKVHAGKPKSTWPTFLPNLLVPTLRRLFPFTRSNEVKQDLSKSTKYTQVSAIRLITFCIRSVMLAFDRYVLLCKAFRKASKGAIVVCDRYPSQRVGAMDSPQLLIAKEIRKKFSIKQSLAELENKIYKKIPSPDIIIKLTVPIDIALERNTQRTKKGKTEDDKFIKIRHLQTPEQEYLTNNEHKIDTNKPLSETLLEVKRILWMSL